MKNLYEALGVSESASDSEIKKVYRQLARENHPDATGGNKAKAERFKEISEAWAVLGDKEKRAEYDRLRQSPLGSDGMPQGFDPSTFEEIFGGMGGGGYRVRTTGSGGPVDVSDLFSSLFGGGGRSGGSPFGQPGRGARSTPRGADMRGALTITFKEAALGTSRKVRTGDGKTVDVQIPPGVESGGRLRLAGKGQPSAHNGAAGDLYLEIEVSPDAHLQRDGDKITLDVPVSLGEALLGARIDVPTVDGKVTVTIPPGTSSGRKLRLRGKGLNTKKGQRGDQICRIEIVMPDITQEEAETQRIAEKFVRRLGNPNPRSF